MLTMQDGVFKLLQFWAERGCLLQQPMNTEVGAGTLNPATFLRVLGHDPWRVAYVEPSVRPDDSRYGDNPNRMQTHTQLQVILKPEPGNPQEVYLESLAVLGIDTRSHDVRFVEDNWASPALGAWGLGWEVWLDGLEITQFTYFQQAGGVRLDPVSVELTYGIERIFMALHGVSHFKDIIYGDGITYGEVVGRAEFEMSRYYLDEADIGTQRQLLELYEAEARRLLDKGLALPAYSYVLKCSHTFNVLDSRGAVSTTDRAQVFARIRQLAREVATLWVAPSDENDSQGDAPRAIAVADSITAAGAAPDGPAPFLLEVGVEELPAREVSAAAAQLQSLITNALARTRLSHGDIRAFATPRRIVAVVDAVAPRESNEDRIVRGPKVSAAFDKSGEPTQAAAGFARSRGCEVSALERIEFAGVEHLAVREQVEGRAAIDALASVLPDAVKELRADTNMRWCDPELSYSRPIRWLVALLGDEVVPFNVSEVASGRDTRLLRHSTQPTATVQSADGYAEFLADHSIVLDAAQRRTMVTREAVHLAETVKGIPETNPDLIEEVANLVEDPRPLLAGFDARYLELPAPILTTVMRKHQRYLPITAHESGDLLPWAVVVMNGEHDTDVVRKGNEAVLRARYEDAAFFWKADLEHRPADMRERLTQLTFHERLGSMYERAERIAAIADGIADHLGLQGTDRDVLDNARKLVKFDLASQLVIEMPSLAGIMAREYASRAGEKSAVAKALLECELPRNPDDELPESLPGAVLSVADRVDLLAGLTAVGAEATGSSDPLGLRRTALALIAILRAHPEMADLSVTQALDIAGAAQPVAWTEESRERAAYFVRKRFEHQLTESGNDASLVGAVGPLVDHPRDADRALAFLATVVDEPSFANLVRVLQRIEGILPEGAEPHIDASIGDAQTRALAAAYSEVVAALPAKPTLAEFVTEAHRLIDPIDRFFEEVLVFDKDPVVQRQRVGLLAAIAQLARAVLDWPSIELKAVA